MINRFLFLCFFYSINIYAIPEVDITPEIYRAIEKFKLIFPIKEYYEFNLLDHSMKDSISYHQKKITLKNINNIPNANWNQSKRSTKINYDKYTVYIKKYNLRKKENSYLQELYKLWKYEVYEKNIIICTIFWTEKGNECTAPITPPVTLHDLRFLIPFMQPEIAKRIFGE